MPHSSSNQSGAKSNAAREGQYPKRKAESASPSKRVAGPVKSPARKRVRVDREGSVEAAEDAPQTTNMYTFTTTKSKDIIDLTSSPQSSPLHASQAQRRASVATRPTNFTPHTGTKKLVVKNFRTTPKPNPEQYYNTVWAQLDTALTAILTQDTRPFSLEELYRGVENVCRQDKAPALYLKLYTKCKEHISTTVKNSLEERSSPSVAVEVLRATVGAWTTWRRQITTVRSIFYYMDRSYLLHSPSLPSIEELGVKLFQDFIFNNPVLQAKILQGPCDLISSDRNAGHALFDANLFREAISMFHVLAVYTKHFEPLFLGQSQTYFKSWAEKQASILQLPSYINECHALIDCESARCDTFGLEETTRRDLNTQMDRFLVVDQEAYLVQSSAVSDLLEQNNVESLRLLHTLLERKHLGEKLRPPFEQYIVAAGSAIVFDEKREADMVVRLLQFKRKLDSIWDLCFKKHEGLGHSLRQAFETFINKTKRTNMTWGTDNDKPGEMIAKYVDKILKGGSRAIPTAVNAESVEANGEDGDENQDSVDEDAVITTQLDQVLDLFRFVHGKAVFEAFYKRDLAKRLLHSRSASADAEKSMLTRLKSECGAGFTHNLEDMFKDIELSREENKSYKQMLDERRARPAVDLNVTVISSSAWPTYSEVVVEIPPEIQQACHDFEQYYKLKHTGRRLAWRASMAHCQLRADFPRGAKELVVSGFQAIVLLYFNEKAEGEQVSYAELQAATKLTEVELKRTLQSLACAQYKVLTKTPRGREIDGGDVFAVNGKFSEAKYRIKINAIQLRETREENRNTHERVAADRQYETQAAIVRILKAARQIRHAQLMAEVLQATRSRGALEPAEIKRQIDKLIEKEYMERDDNSYIYVA